MDTRQLQIFLAVAEAGSITRAAEDLNMSQPALTTGIRNLETSLDTRLFERLPRGVRLTATGEALCRHARLVFTQIDDARSEIDLLKSVLPHEVKVGAGPVWQRCFLPDVVADLSRRHARFEVVVRGGYEQELFAMLRSGEVEFALTEIGHTSDENAFVSQILRTDYYAVICHETHPLIARQPVSLDDLIAYRWAMPDRAEYARRRLNGLFFAANLAEPEVALRSNSLDFLLTTVRECDLLSFVVCTEEEKGNPWPGLVSLRCDFELPSRHAGIVRRAGGWRSPGARLLADELVKRCLGPEFVEADEV